jgi:phosphatidylserine/phosphatidylglycerophosphate/cardiolipin synthase-like enzyme
MDKTHLRITYIAALIFFSAYFVRCDNADDPGNAYVAPPIPLVPAQPSEELDFPETGLRSIFRNDYPFVTQEGPISQVSVPPTRIGNGVKLLSNGEERLKWRLDLIEKSFESIRVQTFIFTNDSAGKLIINALKKKRHEGRDVRLIIDTYTKFSPADRLMFTEVELAGIKIMGFEPLFMLGTADNKLFNVGDINMRFHEKYCVIDGEAAFVGGTNIANEYYRYGGKQKDMWRDQDVLLTGPVVHDIVRAFEDNYEYFKLRREDRLPTNRAVWYSKAWWEISGTKPPPLKPPVPSGRKLIKKDDLDADNVPVRFLRHRPRMDEDYIFQAYIHLIDNARESVLIENAYFVPNHALMTSLMKAAKRGLDVKIITNCDKTNDVKGMQPLSRYTYLALIDNGVKVYEWQGDHPGKGSLHTKCAVFDGVVSLIGSCNLDPRSLSINSEDVVLIDSQKIAGELVGYINTVDIKNSALITRAQAAKWRKPKMPDDKFTLLFGKAMEDWY